MGTTRRPARCHFVPPYLLASIVAAGRQGEAGPGLGDRAAGRSAQRTLRLDARFRAAREAGPVEGVDTGPAWSVHTAANGTTLPGRLVRSEGQPASGDVAVDEAAVGGSGALALFADVYGRNSYDDAGATVVMTVHYGRDYDNAFWNGRQLVFGDGDGRVFDRFTKPVDVLGHELTHAVTEHTAGLVYRDQPGALNESMSDVFAACAKQRMLGQSVTEADWLIGAGLFLPGVRGRALRDMAAPGTAYDDPALGRDPQVGHMDDYVRTTSDNGGVHLNSGIPNRAFYLAATAIGGTSWDGAGAIWYAALTGSAVGPTTGFAGFAAATVAAAGAHSDAVAAAWAQVGVGAGD
ncbi:MAG TPA: M4 family metallopeptidase, partial [Nocardioides sp.]|uniref:M4 family metallopeptidase n=1 Tax=Nocardioides sp. TaxID=35761 RepID=UPI002BAB52E3